VSGALRSGPRLAGLILAGGEGKRFGGPKAWAELPDGRSFLGACAAALVDGGAAPVVATLPPGSPDPGVDGLDAVPLPEPDLDMFASAQVGLRRLLEHGNWDRVAVLPVDHPLVRPQTVAALAAGDGPAVIPSCAGKHGHPVVLDRSTAAAVAGGRLPGPTLREVLVEVGVGVLEVDDPGTVANCNTPDALRRALARGDDC
jgi:CTP:molybdopterin cytidylyltransferase MocA